MLKQMLIASVVWSLLLVGLYAQATMARVDLLGQLRQSTREINQLREANGQLNRDLTARWRLFLDEHAAHVEHRCTIVAAQLTCESATGPVPCPTSTGGSGTIDAATGRIVSPPQDEPKRQTPAFPRDSWLSMVTKP